MKKLFRGLVIAGSLFYFSPIVYTDGPVQSAMHAVIADIIKQESSVGSIVANSWASTIEYASYTMKLNPAMILAVIYTESRFKPTVDAGFGTGLMQVVSRVHNKTKRILLDPHKNILIGSTILMTYKKMSRTESEMLQRYNGTYGVSDEYANKVLKVKLRYEKSFTSG